jgi:hypothetical protein
MRVPWFFQNTRDSRVTEVERRMEAQIVVEQRGQPQHKRRNAELGALLRVAQQVKEDRHKQNNLCPVQRSFKLLEREWSTVKPAAGFALRLTVGVAAAAGTILALFAWTGAGL